jgi:hypothetical protein
MKIIRKSGGLAQPHIGDFTVTGDVITTTDGKGFVANDAASDSRRIKPYDDGGTLTVEVEDHV